MQHLITAMALQAKKHSKDEERAKFSPLEALSSLAAERGLESAAACAATATHPQPPCARLCRTGLPAYSLMRRHARSSAGSTTSSTLRRG